MPSWRKTMALRTLRVHLQDCSVSKSSITISFLTTMCHKEADAPAMLWQIGLMPRSPIFASSIHPLSTPIQLVLPGRGCFCSHTARMGPRARYTAIIFVGGGGESTRGRCYDDDAIAAYHSSGPHVRGQMWPENTKNEAWFFFTLHRLYSMFDGLTPIEQYGAWFKACERWCEFFCF